MLPVKAREKASMQIRALKSTESVTPVTAITFRNETQDHCLGEKKDRTMTPGQKRCAKTTVLILSNPDRTGDIGIIDSITVPHSANC